MGALRILYVTSHWPGAPPYGGHPRSLQEGRLLQRLRDVGLVVINVEGDGEGWKAVEDALNSRLQGLR